MLEPAIIEGQQRSVGSRLDVFDPSFWRRHDIYKMHGKPGMRETFYASPAFHNALKLASDFGCRLNAPEITGDRNWRQEVRETETSGNPAVRYFYGVLDAVTTVGIMSFPQQQGQSGGRIENTHGDDTVDEFSARHALRKRKLNGEEVKIRRRDHLKLATSDAVRATIEAWRDERLGRWRSPVQPVRGDKPSNPPSAGSRPGMRKGDLIIDDLTSKIALISVDPRNWHDAAHSAANKSNFASLEISNVELSGLVDEILAEDPLYDDLRLALSFAESGKMEGIHKHTALTLIASRFVDLGFYPVAARLFEVVDERLRSDNSADDDENARAIRKLV